MTYTLDELRRIDATVSDRIGWDFSRMRDRRAARPWDYETVVPSIVADDAEVLDQGTGGGELILRLAGSFKTCLAIDRSGDMLADATRNLLRSGVSNITFARMDTAALGLADASFDAVINRHAQFNPAEIARVLRPGGYFVTQQVPADRNAGTLFDCFEWGGDFPDDWLVPMRTQVQEFEREGLRIVGLADYSIDWWIEDVESLLFWLPSVPTPAEFDLERHWEGFNVAEARLRDANGFRTQEVRDLLVAQRV